MVHRLECYPCTGAATGRCIGCFWDDAPDVPEASDVPASPPSTRAARRSAEVVAAAPAAPLAPPPRKTPARAPAAAARALVHARWGSAALEVGTPVELRATADGLPGGAPAVFEIKRRGEDARLAVTETTVEANRVVARWTPTDAVFEGDEDAGVPLTFVVKAAGLVAHSDIAILEGCVMVVAEYLIDGDGRPHAVEEFVVADADGREVARGVTDEDGWLCVEVPGDGNFHLQLVDRLGQLRLDAGPDEHQSRALYEDAGDGDGGTEAPPEDGTGVLEAGDEPREDA
jgi:hypothetical protein